MLRLGDEMKGRTLRAPLSQREPGAGGMIGRKLLTKLRLFRGVAGAPGGEPP